MEENLRDLVDDTMYRRGEVYYRYGNVQWIDASIPKSIAESGCIEIEAGVLGTEDYYVTLLFDAKTFRFKSGECDCPYDDYCKHMAATGLKFIDKFQLFLDQTDFDDTDDSADVAEIFVAWLKGKPSSMRKPREIFPISSGGEGAGVGKPSAPTLETTLRSIGIDPNTLSLSVLEELRGKMGFTAKITATAPKPEEKPKPTAKPFAERYHIVINMSYGKIHPDIVETRSTNFYYRMNNAQETASRLLKKEMQNLTETENDLLVFLRDEDSWKKDYDHGELFLLLKNSGLAVYFENKAEDNKAHFEENPKKINAEIFKRENKVYSYQDYRIETVFVFRIDRKYTDTALKSVKETLFVGTKYAVVLRGKNIALYPISSLIREILKRILNKSAYDYRYYDYGKTEKEQLEILRETELTGEEAILINNILPETRMSFEIISDLSPDIEIREYKNAKQTIVIDYDREKNTLDARAVIDYGLEKIDVSKSVSASHRMGKVSFERQIFLPYVNHIIRISEKTISFAKIERQKEIALFKKFYYDEKCGFNKSAKCHREGEKQIAKFAFSAFSEIQKLGIPIEFTKDELRTATGSFKADFAVDMDAEIDWLAFDVACYCGEDKILPEDLRDYIHNNREFLKMADGTLKKVTNREELERFVAMLDSFNARENGRFEGRVYNAPELDNIFTSSDYYNAKLSAGFQKFIKEAKSGRPVKRVRIPIAPAKILRDYQKDAVHWFYFLRKYRFAGILADDMGLGKTLQALTLLHMNKTAGTTSLVVCPKTLLSVWQDEATKFFPDMKVIILDGSPTERALKIRDIHKFDLAITSYPTLQKDEGLYKGKKKPFHYLLLDEAQNIKNHQTKNSQSVKKIDAEYRLALTGTPLENTVAEIWSIFEFLMPGFLGNHTSFTRGFLKPIMKENDGGALAHLRQKVQCFMLRRTKGEVLKELPDKIEQTRSCKMTDAQNMLYQEILARVKKDIFDSVKEKGYEKSHIHILAGLTKLRQVCNHPVLLLKDKNYRKYESAKLELFNELVQEIAAAGRKVLVFSQFTTMLDILAEELKSRGIGYAYLSGKTNNRKEVVASFNEDKTKTVFLISLKAGGTGLTLTAADNVIIFDPWWNPSAENQAIDRTHRIGQKNTVNVYKLITEGTIEEKILELQKRKKFLFDSLVGKSGDLFKKITWDDIRGLF